MIRLMIPEVKRPKTVEELEVAVNSHKNQDVPAFLGQLSLKDDKLFVEDKSYAVRASGMKGLLGYIKMPSSYASSVPTDLLYDSVNRLTSKTYADKEVLLRIQDDEVRAILSPSYVPLDSSELFKYVSKTKELGLKPARITYDGDNLVASMVTGTEVHAVDTGDISKIGLELETSDINEFGLSSNAFLFRLICTNGTILPARMSGGLSFSQKGSNPETVWSLFSNGFSKILDKMSQVDSDFLIRLQNKKVDASNFVKVKNKLSEFVGGRKISNVLYDMEQEVLEKGVDLTVYDLYNRVTNVATTETNIVTARNLEIAAGELLFDFGVSVN